ncbi:tyrosine-type recombinase/integrase [Xenorhabdus bovienii]|uniref:tyrosine-type recombinase/integrase n=1 Tax=Xenorhabdus bovienii TaxID=40576 RepID=UPI00237CD3CE|nr:integrase arm-type DNA-binding domain-containing protein [Xenorhabdus bovienii]MDE1475499.1 tyrosine-type recombinase/integrase [Xenorhabdus bovienii]MDE9552348.1 tyrosine-type recombinase/integrase [Xenorhabdus bovienii]
MKLTARQIETAKPQDKDFKLSDGGGMYLLIKVNGSKYWRLKYRIAGKEKLLAIGTFPLISLAEARKKRDEAKKLMAEGIDPNQDKKQKKLAAQGEINNTFENITREWYSKRVDRWSASYAEEMMETFEKDVFPYIGKRPIAEIKPMELMAVLSRINDRGATEKLRKVRQRCGEVWKYAIITGRAEYNPAPDLASAFITPKKTHYAFLMTNELTEFFKALNAYTGSFMVKMGMRLQMITGVRPGELRKAEWSEIDFQKSQWEIPAEKMKMRRPHIVPLSQQAVDILEQMKPITGQGKYLFPGRINQSQPMSEMALSVLIRRIGYAGRVTGHGFRHTMSTILHEQGYNTAWIETQLAHVDKNSIRGTYNHAQYLDGRREMLQWYADYMETLERGENVIHGKFGKSI